MTSQFHGITTPCLLTLLILCMFLQSIYLPIYTLQYIICNIYILLLLLIQRCHPQGLPQTHNIRGHLITSPATYLFHFRFNYSFCCLFPFSFLVYLLTPLHLDYTECPKSHCSEILRYKECDCWQSDSIFVFAAVGNTVDTLALQFNSAALHRRYVTRRHNLIFWTSSIV
jgi:hypothetical protein